MINFCWWSSPRYGLPISFLFLSPLWNRGFDTGRLRRCSSVRRWRGSILQHTNTAPRVLAFAGLAGFAAATPPIIQGPWQSLTLKTDFLICLLAGLLILQYWYCCQQYQWYFSSTDASAGDTCVQNQNNYWWYILPNFLAIFGTITFVKLNYSQTDYHIKVFLFLNLASDKQHQHTLNTKNCLKAIGIGIGNTFQNYCRQTCRLDSVSVIFIVPVEIV